MFKVCNSPLGKGKDLPFSSGITNQELADNFNGFFTTKITNIRSKLIEQNLGLPDMLTEHCTIPRVLKNYHLLICDDVAKIVLASPTKTCEADPIPTELFKKILPSIIEPLTKLVNQLLQSGEFPDDLKEALVKPLLKKITLEPINKNYRPVSNLLFMGKLMERCVTNQLMEHIHANDLMDLYSQPTDCVTVLRLHCSRSKQIFLGQWTTRRLHAWCCLICHLLLTW